MKSTRIQAAKLSLILLPLLLTFGTKRAIAQITPATDGTGTVVQTQNNQINISGGTQAGQNQFHSFQQFGVNAGQTANFMANPNIANILGRVTGGDASLINGMLKVSGSNANLYLMNPSGIIFGKDASLNLPAAFTATTANGIGFGNGNWFNAIGSNNYAVLTANPTSFGFSGLSGSIVNAGNLSVNPGQSIALVGGTVVNTGTIAAPGGNITIAAIPGGKMVRIGQDGMVLSLDLPTSDKALINAPIATPLSLPALLTGGSVPSAMGVVVEDGVIKLTGGSASVNGTLNADGMGLQNGGNAIVYADNHLDFGGTIAAKGGELGGNGGFVDTSGKGSITIAPNAKVLTTAAKGLMGTWLIDPADLEVIAGTGGTIGGAGSTIGAGTIVTALNGTNVNLQADNSITVNAAISTSTNIGNLTLTAPIANLNQAIVLRTGSTLSGTATTVNVGATGTVQNGIDVSAAGGTVNLAAATYTLTQEVGINKNITVRGTGAGTTTVSGNNAVRVFNIGAGSTVTLDGMSIVNGRIIGSNVIGGNGIGGGIYNSGTLTVSNSILSGNSSSGGRSGRSRGGGIYNSGTLTVSSSILSGNSSSGSGTFSIGGGIYSEGGTVTVSNSTLSRNSSSGTFSRGGGIYSGGGTLTVSNSTISGNSANYVGGGIYSDRGNLTVSNSTLSGNSANSSGGGIYNNGGRLTIANSTLSGNSARFGGGIYSFGTLTIGNSTLSGNSADDYGGGIFSFGTLTIGNSTLSGNSADDYGGGISNYGTVTIDDSTFSENSAKRYGGGIYNAGRLTVNNSTLKKNLANYGGGIYNEGGEGEGQLTVSNSTLSSNSALYDGGGIYSTRGNTVLNSSTVSNNTSDAGGGIYSKDGTLDVTNSTIAGNSATSRAIDETDRGGGIYNGSRSTANVIHSTISGNTASGAGNGEGGGIANYGTFKIANSIVAGNTAKTANDEVANLGGTFTSQGHNLYGQNNSAGGFIASSTDILLSTLVGTALAPLGNYGGTTQTMALLPGSPALNAGNSTLAVDQRGMTRVTPDIGAFESQGFTLVATAGTPQNITVGKAGTTPLTVTVKANNPIEPVAGGIVNINFTAPNSPSTATLSTSNLTIDASGNASTIATANTTEGSYTVKAIATGITGTADFTLTNIAERVISIILPVDQNPVINNPSNSDPQVQVPIDQSTNLETLDRVQQPPSLNSPNPLLCALRKDDRMIGQPLDGYKGVPDCKAKVIQSTPIKFQIKTDR